MNKKEVQKRVLQNGKPLALSKFSWDEKTNTFSSDQYYLVIDFNCLSVTVKTGSYSTIKTGGGSTITTGGGSTITTGGGSTITTGIYSTVTTGSYSTVTTGSGSTVKTGGGSTIKTGGGSTITTGGGSTITTGIYSTVTTGSYSTVTTGSYSTVTTGSYSTVKTGGGSTITTGIYSTVTTGSYSTVTTESYCAIIRNGDYFQVIQPKENETVMICPYYIEGYISKRENENDFYMETPQGRIEHIIADNILSKVISKRKGVYKVINHGEEKETYLIERDGIYSHGKTLKEAKESFMYKIKDRDTSKYEGLNMDSELTLEEGIKAYRTITGACEGATRSFVESLDRQDSYTIKDIIDITKGQYNNEVFKEFFKN